MLAKKDATTVQALHPHAPTYQQELEILYARRSAIDALIESLENYDRFRAPKPPGDERKLA